MKRHPWGKVPAIETADGFMIYESRPICRYLAKRYSLPLLPSESDIEAVTLFEQAQNDEMLYFAEPAGKISFEKFAKKLMGLSPDEVVVSKAIQSLETFFNVSEHLLQQKDYMAGNDFTLVDIYYVPLIYRLFTCGYGDLITGRKNVSAWWSRCTCRPAVKEMLDANQQTRIISET